MKRNLFLVSAIAIATLASCTKDSALDPTVESAINSQEEIGFSTYASTSTTTKGSDINSNGEFQTEYGSFDVMALVGDADFTDPQYDANGYFTGYDSIVPTDGDIVTYFNFSTVNYEENGDSTDATPYPKWVNENKMYWPNENKMVYFAAYAPADVVFDEDNSKPSFAASASGGEVTYAFKFPYKVTDTVADQIDLMYGITAEAYVAPEDRYKMNAGDGNSYITTGADYTNEYDDVNIHFKHALTQIAFTATKDDDIEVYVKSITVCNVYNEGVFTAEFDTEDADSSVDTDSSTVGNSASSGDQVNAGNFGTWTTLFDTTGEYNGWSITKTDDKRITTTDPTTEYTVYYAENSPHPSIYNYSVPFVQEEDAVIVSPGGDNSIQLVDGSSKQLSSLSDVLMLKPQKLTAWIPNTSTEPNCVGIIYTQNAPEGYELNTFSNVLGGTAISSDAGNSLSYLAINCEIYHQGISDAAAKIHSGYIFVPFSTDNIKYSEAATDNQADDADEWLAGYRITYCLNFGGGYVVDEENHDDDDDLPEPGTVPDTETYTLRTITYTTTVDEWVDVEQDIDLGDFENGVDDDTSSDN